MRVGETYISEAARHCDPVDDAQAGCNRTRDVVHEMRRRQHHNVMQYRPLIYTIRPVTHYALLRSLKLADARLLASTSSFHRIAAFLKCQFCDDDFCPRPTVHKLRARSPFIESVQRETHLAAIVANTAIPTALKVLFGFLASGTGYPICAIAFRVACSLSSVKLLNHP